MRNRWFWIVNLALLALYGWTLTEESAVRVRVEGDECTAVFPESRHLTRTSSIPCPGLQGGFVGLYFAGAGASAPNWGPLDWLAPRSGWRSVIFTELRENGRRLSVQVADDVPGWRRIWGEWQPVEETAVMRWQTPIYGDYLTEADLRRPAEPSGILLLRPDGKNGWAFITDPDGRRGVWWEWENGRPVHPIIGIPYQKPALAQAQSLLRRALRAHQAGLLLLLVGWVLGRGLARMNADFVVSLRSSRPLRFIFRPRTAVPLLTLSVLAAAIYIANDALERIPHVQDSVTYLFQAEMLARGRLWAAAPPLPDFFKHEFLTVADGRWFGQYPPGFPAVLALGVRLGLPWLVNPLLAALTIPLLYWLGKLLYGRSTGLLAAALALVSPFFLFLSGSFMSHAAELFWMVLLMAAWTQAARAGGGRRWTLLAGAAWGMLFLTRQATAVAVGLPFFLLIGAGKLWEQLGSRDWRLINLQSLISNLRSKTGWLLAAAVPLASLLFLNQYLLTGDPFRDPRLLERPFDRPGFGADVGENFNAFTMTEVNGKTAVDWFNDPAQPPRGHTLARGLYNTEQNWRALETDLFGWLPVLTLAFVWLALVGRRPSREDIALLAGFGGIILIYVFYWADGIMYGPRYYYGALPALLLLTARGMQATAQKIGRSGQTAVAILAAVFILGNLLFYLPAAAAEHRGYNFINRHARAQVEAEIEGKALIFVANNPLNWWEYGRFFSGNTPWLDGRIIYARDLGDEMNGRLLPYFPDYAPYRWREGNLARVAEWRGGGVAE